MALMTFGQSYSVGVQSIDSQHKVLFEIVNELYAAMMKGQAKNLTGPFCTSWRSIPRTTSAQKRR